MNSLTKFKNQIFLYGIITAVIFELVSIPFLGLDIGFFYGLALGTAIAIVNFNLMEFTLKVCIQRQKKFIAFLGYLIRLAIYGGVFYKSIKISLISGIGTVLGFLTITIAIFYLHGFKAKFSKGRIVREEPEELKAKKHWYDYNDEESED